MQNIGNSIIDAGPLIALFNKDDKYHKKTKYFLKDFKGRLYTSWAVVTEVMHMLNSNHICQINFLKFIERDGLKVVNFSKDDIARIIDLFKKYNDVPVDLADATLIILSEKENISNIITIDSDFYIYRNKDDNYIRNIFSTRWA